ncbi:MAG: helix-turn-helix transcriptional regulator [Proteobacteria bacterium]|nr:helix-turn-helix transcriptional regulator [Pseudomonadota bacterium]
MTNKPDPIDVHVGSRVRLRRTLLGMSQSNLGDALGLTFQQIQKYERGANRIGSSRLYRLSKILDVPVAFFFDEMAQGVATSAKGVAEKEQKSFEPDRLATRETLELVRAYYRIKDEKVRKRVFELVKAIGKAS